MNLIPSCAECLIRKNTNNYPKDADPGTVRDYQDKIRTAVSANCGVKSSPETISLLHVIYREHFGPMKDFSEEKQYYNDLMLGLEDELQGRIEAAPDPLLQALRYAMTGNYIDFAALNGNVEEERLLSLLEDAERIRISEEMLEQFRSDAAKAKTLVYMTDNCGEIVCDKLLIRQLKKVNPGLYVTVIVRGKPIFNDATIEDAKQTGMDLAADALIGSGSDMPGNALGGISSEAAEASKNADLLISKGQANFEGLHGCGLPIYYMFLCKCDLFTGMFKVPKLTGILTREV